MKKEIVQENPMSSKVRYNNKTRKSHIFGPKSKYSIQQVPEDTQYIKVLQLGGNSRLFLGRLRDKLVLSDMYSVDMNCSPMSEHPSKTRYPIQVCFYNKHFIYKVHSNRKMCESLLSTQLWYALQEAVVF